MDRRSFLQAAALVGAGSALGLSRLALASNVAQALAGDAGFSAAVATYPWLVGWQDAPAFDGTPRTLDVEGHVPAGLRGTLWRNGPARFSRAGVRYQHWFDGDGMIHAWDLDGQKASHRARFVGTGKYQREEAAGRFLLPASGTRIADSVPIRNSDDMNTANTAVFTHDGELYALWEGGSAYALDAQTLQAKGPKSWRADLTSVPFSAHPLHEPDGSVRNFGLLGKTLVLWHLARAGEVLDARTVSLPFPGYLHAFSMTERYMVFVVLPYVADRRDDGQPYFESLHWQPERGCRVLVVDKHDLDRLRWYGLPAGTTYHYGPAQQRGREIWLQACWHGCGVAALSPFQSEMRGVPQRVDKKASLQRIRLGLDNGRASMDMLMDGGVDFPMWDTSIPDRGAAISTYALTGSDRSESGYFDAVTKIDSDAGVVDRYSYGA
ncbi:MAG: carotenoid oxygenase family protein, partial [Rhodanobacter sp.]